MMRRKSVILGKNIVGGYRITAGANFQHTFRKYLLDPPLKFSDIFCNNVYKCKSVIYRKSSNLMRALT